MFQRRGLRYADELLGVVVDEAVEIRAVTAGFEGHEDDVVMKTVGSTAVPGVQFFLQALVGREFDDMPAGPVPGHLDEEDKFIIVSSKADELLLGKDFESDWGAWENAVQQKLAAEK